jgi:hypothetical protein
MSSHGRPRRASRGRAYRIRVRGERRVQIDFPKLSRALLEHAALEAHQRQGEGRRTEANHEADLTRRREGVGDDE